ncbi:MAG: hypothetical protein MK052_04450 [Alphaproteobacteria bacterium]|nr:hypothetical protein [Alphaproteobacteria bacterium]
MSQKTDSRSLEMGEFTFHDDSRHTKVALGKSFSVVNAGVGLDGIKALIDKPAPTQQTWNHSADLIAMQVISPRYGTSRWNVACEESITFPKRHRAFVSQVDKPIDYHIGVDSHLTVTCEPQDLMESLPDSVFGMVLGVATGISEAKKLLHDAMSRSENYSIVQKKREWRAPRFSFSLRTANGSPFVERWSFAVQESATDDKRFRVWIEQQRTGKETHLMLLANGDVEGMQELEALPAAIHGAGLGMLLGMNYAIEHLEKTQQRNSREAEIMAEHEQRMAILQSLSDKEAELVLDQYVNQIRERSNSEANE